MIYDIIVVGGGHAGCEAALIGARQKKKVLLITSNINNIADLACNPSIGGPAKGVIVREIDALGGEMANIADKSSIQMKMLNTKKGPAVRALRSQADKSLYQEEMINVLKKEKNLDLLEGMVEDLIIEERKIKGVVLNTSDKVYGEIVILTTGTYLKGKILYGDKQIVSGPHGEKPSLFLSDKLRELGFTIKRLKTGTPPRIKKDSIDYDKTIIQPGDNEVHNFKLFNKTSYNISNQLPCFLTYTTDETHRIINENLEKSSMYGGFVEGVGPRYCPSIEDKIVRFYDKEKHQIFLEPEGRNSDDIYIQGLSTSMPKDIQEKMISSIPGLENAVINKYAYAIEYDAIDSIQLKPSLETKIIENLFTAGQINGTSGYEEAAAQGLIAGINAVNKINNKEPLILKRNEAYIGVLIDDLVTKGVKDPYRLLTSRAEYRLILRHDNADLRLMEIANNYGLLNETVYEKFLNKKENMKKFENLLRKIKITPKKEINDYLLEIGSTTILDGITLYELLKRPEIEYKHIRKYIDVDFEDEVIEEVIINIKYEGYIKKAEKEVEKMLDYENIKISDNLNYEDVPNLAHEAVQKLNEIKPVSIGQALRISGVNPADITMLMLYLKRKKNE